MKRKVDVEEIGAAIEPVLRYGDDVLIEKEGRLVAAIIPAAQYEELERRRAEARQRLDEFVQANREMNRAVPPEEIESAIEEAVREARRPGRSRRADR